MRYQKYVFRVYLRSLTIIMYLVGTEGAISACLAVSTGYTFIYWVSFMCIFNAYCDLNSFRFILMKNHALVQRPGLS